MKNMLWKDFDVVLLKTDTEISYTINFDALVFDEKDKMIIYSTKWKIEFSILTNYIKSHIEKIFKILTNVLKIDNILKSTQQNA